MPLRREPLAVLPIWLFGLLFAASIFSAVSSTSCGETGVSPRDVGVRNGICVVLGLPQANQPEFITGLAKGNELVIYFQSPQSAEVTEVRKVAEEAALLGKRIFASLGDWASIHVADNLADAVLLAPSAEGSVASEEILRVLRPGGKAFVGNQEIVKPWPEGSDDWSYPYHGPDNNPQSADQIARAPYLTHFIAEPKFGPSPAVTVAAGGMIFRAFGHLSHKENQNAMLNTLVATNAYNGTILWKRRLKEGFMVLRNTIIATPDMLYLADDESCKLIDTATGQLKDEIISPDPEVDGTVWKWMALENGVLYALIGGEEIEAPVLTSEVFGVGGWPRANWQGFDYPDAETAWGQGRTLLAIDVTTKEVLWRHREQEFMDNRAVCMKQGRIYFYCPEKLLGCVNAEDGQVVWKTSEPELMKAIGPRFPEEPRWTGLSPMVYVRGNDKFLFFSGPRIPRVVAVSVKDGTLAWQKEVPIAAGGSVHLLLREDALYAIGISHNAKSFSMEYETGKVLSEFLGRRACTAVTGSVDSIFYRATGGTVRLDLASGEPEHIAPMRPPCYEGIVISNGLVYWGSWKCRCQLSLYGHISLAPAGKFNFHPGVDDSRLVLGPGDPTTVELFNVDPHDWPTYQGDNNRTSMTKVVIPKKISQQWAFEPTSTGMPTAPVVAGGVVFVGDQSGVLRALDTSDGRQKWKAYTGGAIFFPPAVWEGRVYVGSADGHVYAFEAATGRSLWKFRAAPADRWIPVLGKLISTWPVAGGVVVDEGVVYAAAGIAHYDGTHVYALDAVNGEVKWYNDTSGQLSPKTKSGVSLQGSLYLDKGQLCFTGGNVCPVARYDLKTGECISTVPDRISSAFRTAFYPYYPEYGQYVSLDHKLAGGRSLSYAAEYGGSLHSTLALLAPPPPGAENLGSNWRILPPMYAPKVKPTVLWELKTRPMFNSFVVGGETLLAAGQTTSDSQTDSFLWAVNIEDGGEVFRHELPAPVVKGGTAVDHKARIIASLQDGRVLCFAAAD